MAPPGEPFGGPSRDAGRSDAGATEGAVVRNAARTDPDTRTSGAFAPDAAPTAPVGGAGAARMLLGRYRILSTNDEGGFGTVSTCWDTRLQRRVAIKRMPLTVSEGAVPSSTLEEALGEARTSSMLSHPNIVTVYDFETDAQSSYLVMEYVDGLDLQELLARVEGGVLTFDECAHVLESVGSALEFAHENGVLHLDIKPANIMISRDGTVKLADFGMASLASAAGFEGARGGTVGYMPPEQICGDYVDERTDVFSLAVVAWQALTGSCPYAAATPERSLEKIRRGPTPSLSHVEPELAGVVESTLLRALDPSPAARMSSVAELVGGVVRALGDAREGKESLAWLISQSGEEEGPASSPDGGQLTPWERFPWLEGALVRAAAALPTAAVLWRTLPRAFSLDGGALAACCGAGAAATAALPVLGVPLATVSSLLAIASGATADVFPLALLLALAALLWWVSIGRRQRLGAFALLTPLVLGSPEAAVPAAGGTLPPAPALGTAVAAWLLERGSELVGTWGLDARGLLAGVVAAAGDPGSWASLAGVTAASWVCSLLVARGTRASCIAGYALSALVLASFQFAWAQMENITNPGAGDLPSFGVAVVLGVIMCVTTVLHGPGGDAEGDERA